MNKVIGLCLVVLGAGLVYWGYDMSETMGAKVTEFVNDSIPDDVLYRYIGGAISLAVGIYLVFKK